jgi:hypothetical protein
MCPEFVPNHKSTSGDFSVHPYDIGNTRALLRKAMEYNTQTVLGQLLLG